MATAIVMPKLSDTMTEGKIVKWNKREGERVGSGEAVAEVETDKATLELEAYEDGTLLKILIPEGGKAAVGATVAVIGQPGEELSAFLPGAAAEVRPAPEQKPPEEPAPPPSAAPAAEQPTPPPSAALKAEQPARPPEREVAQPAPSTPGRHPASPLARRMARELGLELAALAGSGPGGRIVARDVEAASRRGAERPAAAPARPAPAPPAAPRMLELPAPPPEGPLELTGMRRGIAERMSQSKREAPHFYLSVETDMEELVALREQLKTLGARVSINDFLLKAAGFALLKVPEVNRTFEGGRVLQHGAIDVGMAVALPDGLLAPVLRGVDRLSLTQVGALARELAERARGKRLKPEEYQGGSVTVTNLGMLGIDSFLAIINPPQSAIVAVGTVAARPAVVDGKVVARQRTWVTLSCDHRVVDGATGARYLGEIKRVLEQPLALLA